MEIIPDSIRIKLDKITQLIDTYIINELDSYTYKNFIHIDTMIDKITIFYDAVKSMFEQNPFKSSQEKLKLKRTEIELLYISNNTSDLSDDNILSDMC